MARTLKNFPFHPLNEFWKRMRMMRPATPEKLIQRLLPFEKVKKDVHKGRDAQIPRKNLETPREGPAVGVKLGRGSVDFSKQLPFEGSERKA